MLENLKAYGGRKRTKIVCFLKQQLNKIDSTETWSIKSEFNSELVYYLLYYIMLS